jgi:hypothetical protein
LSSTVAERVPMNERLSSIRCAGRWLFPLFVATSVGCYSAPADSAGGGGRGGAGSVGGGGAGARGGASGGSAGKTTGAGGAAGSGGNGGTTGGNGGSAGTTGGSDDTGAGGAAGGVAGAAGGGDETGAGGAAGSAIGGGGGTLAAGTAGAGGQAGVPALSPWPGSNAVVVLDALNAFPNNLSGLCYQPAASGQPAVLWGIQNGPSVLYQLGFDGTIWTWPPSGDWTGGKALHFPDGTGDPDAEGVTKAEWDSSAIYVSIERDNNVGNTSRLGVLRFDTDDAGTALTATNEWNLVADLPPAGANLGLEAITWIPDTALVDAAFYDESAGAPYDPSRYANHGTGLFFVGLEQNGMIYAFALDHVGGGHTRVATVDGGQASIMDLDYDRDVGQLWSQCDNTCGNHAGLFGIGSDGRFHMERLYDRPSTLPDSNNEGITVAPESECVNGGKSFYWADDDDANGHAIRRDTIPCGRLY